MAEAASPSRTEVVVTLGQPSLARFVQTSRVLSARTKAERLDLSSPTNTAYLDDLVHSQDAIARRIERTIPSARVRWRYRIVLDGLAVTLPASRLGELSRIPGVASVRPTAAYRVALQTSPELIGADQLWGLPDLTTAGEGIKIGIIDQGVDQVHPFFDPTGYSYPLGFPKGNTAYTTPKVIVARSFTPPGSTSPLETLPFADAGSQDDHGTHVAGIAAGDYDVVSSSGARVSGVAPRAYLGNYKALSINIGNYALIENATELIAAIEAAVSDGMDVINMSLGEIELDPARSIVDDAVDGAAAAGVVPVVSAGNEFEEYGRGSISTPGSAPGAISVAAATEGYVIAGFSSSGPTPLARTLKPDVTRAGSLDSLLGAPTRGDVGAVQRHEHGGTARRRRSRAAPAASSDLDRCADQVRPRADGRPGLHRHQPSNGGAHDPGRRRDDQPSARRQPAHLRESRLALVRARCAPGLPSARSVALTDAGGGSGPWAVSIAVQRAVERRHGHCTVVGDRARHARRASKRVEQRRRRRTSPASSCSRVDPTFGASRSGSEAKGPGSASPLRRSRRPASTRATRVRVRHESPRIATRTTRSGSV